MKNVIKTIICGAVCAATMFSLNTASADQIMLPGRVRDFNASHPDMEWPTINGYDPNITELMLGSDGKPVFSGTTFKTVDSKESFDQWYNDTPGINMGADLNLVLDNTISANPHIYTYKNDEFWPIDDQLFGNEGNVHNQHFTYELHTTGVYIPGDVLRFEADDDLFVFFNGFRVIDLGGVHRAIKRTIGMDYVANALGLNPGDSFDYDLFYAERHTKMAVLRYDVPIPTPGAVFILALSAGIMGIRRKRA